MCGIIGCIGQPRVKEILLKGLEKLEYRGYDSAGIALLDGGEARIYKEKGRIAELRRLTSDQADAPVGIGHTRWATHGGPNRRNAHPHRSMDGRFTLVHNGVIDNYKQLRERFLPDTEFASETDSEVIVQLVGRFAAQGVSTLEALQATLDLLHGSYALALLDAEHPDTLYLAKRKSPLLIGQGAGFHVIASDALAALTLTQDYIELQDGEMALVQADTAVLFNEGGIPVQRQPFRVEVDAEDLEKGPYKHYMLKEIDEQPAILRKLVGRYLAPGSPDAVDPAIIAELQRADRVILVACGTSYHAALVGKTYLEQMAGIPAEAHIASEFLYHPPLLPGRPFFVFLSQSGETADSRGVLTLIRQSGYPTLAITNVPQSTLARESDYTLATCAGPEIAVASTKAYTAQIAVLAILAHEAAEAKGRPLPFDMAEELGIAASSLDSLLDKKDQIDFLVWERLSAARSAFFIGRGLDYQVCLEAALKLKEISYIQAEGYAGGELKHGTIALIEEGTPVIALLSQTRTAANLRSNVEEVLARGADVLCVSMEGLESDGDALVLPAVHESLSPLLTAAALQLFAYYAALYRGCDVDKPRNLAKSVTVE